MTVAEQIIPQQTTFQLMAPRFLMHCDDYVISPLLSSAFAVGNVLSIDGPCRFHTAVMLVNGGKTSGAAPSIDYWKVTKLAQPDVTSMKSMKSGYGTLWTN